ncbi:DUF3693 domain-containing protein [Pseudomonas sp. MYb118]|uniref:DUF3693 domain-containing protein n=1 Tax=Pseudomonas sp. MYb118 TaxID=1848720 RepID=UPI0034CD559A
MVVNDNAGCLDARGAWVSIASRLAPTGFVSITHLAACPDPPCGSEPARDGR